MTISKTVMPGMAASMICAAGVLAQAQPKPAAAGAAGAGLLNDWPRQQSAVFEPWDVGGQFRIRYEIKDNAGSFPNRDFISSGQINDNDYLLLREKFHVGYTPQAWVKFYVEGRNSTEDFDKRRPSPESDKLELHQAWITFGDAKKFPFTLKAGRQEMIYGDERFIGVSDWSNVQRVFDLGKLRWEQKEFWVDAFSGRVVINDDNSFNVANDYDLLSGIYAGTRALAPFQDTEFFFLARNVGTASPNAIAAGVGGPAARDIYTFGSRLKSVPGTLGPWDYSAEIAAQFGSLNLAGRRQEHRAVLADFSAGYTWTKSFGSPRLGAGYTYATGDRDPNDNRNTTFEPLFGTNHKLYGVMDLWGPRNVESARLTASLKPHKKLTLNLEYHLLWLADDRDLFYPESGAGRTANGYGRNSAFSKFVGTELDLIASYSVTSWLDAQVGGGRFFAGDYIRQSVTSLPANGRAVDATWFYIQTRVNF